MKPKKIALFNSLALGLLGLLLLVVKGFHFENNDDVGMFCMVKGLLQFEATPHLFFQSSYLGYLYQWLYANLPAIEWYFVVYYFFMLAGLVYISYCILVGAKNIQSCFTILLLCFLASAEVLLGGLQFTKAAIWLGLAAAIGIQYYLQGNRHWHHLIFAFLFMLFGMLYRDSFAVISFGIFSVGSLLWLYKNKGIYKRWFAVFGAAGALIISVFWLNGNATNKHIPGFAEQNTRRARVNDFGILKKLDAYPELKEKYTLQFPELELIRYWIYPKEFAKNQALTKALEEIYNLPEPQGRLLDSIKGTTLRFVSGWQNKLTLFVLLALLLISYLLKKKIPLEVWFTGTVLILFLYATGYMYKTVPPRVGNALLTAALFYCLAFIGLGIGQSLIQKLLRYTSLAAGAFLVLLGYLVNIDSAKKSDWTYGCLRDVVYDSGKPVFLTYQDIHNGIYLEALWPERFNDLKLGSFYTIGWCMTHPAYLASLKMQFGGDDILKMLANGKMLLTDNPYNRELAKKLLACMRKPDLRIIPVDQNGKAFLKLETKN
ncbi:MAG: hypothetical protein EXR21_05845 [Flavobacteriaceae bacterium]|nr:hypothetical protein [Flavobacteriaceae bacterium]